MGPIFLPGRVYRESSGSTHRADAVKVLKRRLSEIGAGRLIGPDAEKTTFEALAQMVLDDYRGAAPPLEYYLSASKPGRYPRKPRGKLQLQIISREIAWAVNGKSASLKQEALRNGQNGSTEPGLEGKSSLK